VIRVAGDELGPSVAYRCPLHLADLLLPMLAADHVVYVVDDDSRLRDALAELLTSAELNVQTFGSATEYVAFPKPELPACLVLDVELPDMSGLELQRQLAAEEHPPIVFLTGHGDVPKSVRALKAGAVDFLTKPFSDLELLGAIETAIARDRESREKRAELASLRGRWSALTPREREVLPLVVKGLLNKQAAATLGISEVTLQIHRGKIMHKMDAKSLAELVRMAGVLGIP
jgi:FixJ family two-component response regulator